MTTSTYVERRCRFARRALLSVTTILCSGLAAPAFAQLAAPAPMRQSIDANGVDLFAGTLNVDAPGMSMGQGDQGLSYHQLNRGSGWTDSITAALNQNGNTVTVSLGGTTDQFTASGSAFFGTQGNGASLTLSNGVYTYTRSDGTQVHFDIAESSPTPYYANVGRATDIVLPSGTRLVYAYGNIEYCNSHRITGEPDVCTGHATAFHLTSVTSSYGYRLALVYGQFNAANYDPDRVNNAHALEAYSTPTGVTETNLAQSGSSGQTLSFGGGGSGTYTVTDPLSRMTSYRMNGVQVAGITRPGSASEDVTVGYSNGRVGSVARPTGTWSYASSDVGGARTVTVTDPKSQTTSYVFDIASSLMTKMTDALGHVTSWTYTPDGMGNVATVTAPEQNSVEYGYDGRGNVTSTALHAKSGTDTIMTSAEYSATCDNAVTCNQPTSTTDANGNTTEYTYDATHGGVLTVTGPAPVASGTRSQARYGYTPFTDYLGGTVYRQTRASVCQTQAGVDVTAPAGTRAGCEGTLDEVVTTTDYGSIAANNLLPTSTSTGAGDGTLTATSSVRYDAIGNVIASIDAASSETDYTFDADREPLTTVSPDPDGPGPMNRRAATVHYLADGSVDSRSVGSSDASGTQITPLQIAAYGYDAAHRLVRETDETDTSGNTVFAVTQYGYDSLGRRVCTVARMNPTLFNSLSLNSCEPGQQGSDGPDRVTQLGYDAVGHVTAVTSAYGTAAASTEQASYTANGKLEYTTDANGNRTRFIYDGFDRLSQMNLPDPANPGVTSASDYQAYLYDANGNVTYRRTRAGQEFRFTYDALNRLTKKAVPSGMRDVHYAYDLLGRPTEARFEDPTGADKVLVSYDALGRTVSATTSMGGVSRELDYQYDITGNRTRITHPDGVYFDTSYDPLGEMTKASWWTLGTGKVPFLSILYDDLGRRTETDRASSLTRYTWDGSGGQLGSISQRFATNTGNVKVGFGYNAAGQFTSQTRDNEDYAYTGASNANRAYAANGLNQYTSVAGAVLGYDANGNLTSDGTNSYGYDAENKMVSASTSNGTTLTYDPLGRLWQTASPVYGKTQFLYDGQEVAAEYDGDTGGMRRRFMFGPGIDEPILSDEGSSMNCSGTRFLHTDQQGSVVALADCSGNRAAVNAYDEYGNPKAGNQGRYGYTGQAWLPDLGLWNYKARIYNPVLGRFMQTDPIGYGDGLNWYGYAHADPINSTDPSGLAGVTCNDGRSFTDAEATAASEANGGGDPCGASGTKDVVVTGGGGGGGGSPAPVGHGGGTSPGGNGGGRGGTPMPQKTTPPKKTLSRCIKSALLSRDGASLLIDGGGLALTFAFPEARLAQIAVSGASIIASGSTGDLIGLGNGVTNYHFTSFGKQAAVSGGLFNAIVDAGAKFTGGLAILNDVNNIRKDVNKCLAGKDD